MTRRAISEIGFGVFFSFFVGVIFFLLSQPVFAETIELVTYYPAPGSAGNEHVNDFTVGPGYLGENPAPGVALIETRLGIGINDPREQIHITGNLRLPPTTATTGIIMSGTNRFIHRFGGSNFFAGTDAGNFTLTGGENVGIGTNAMQNLTNGTQNVAVGVRAMRDNTSGERNSAFGMESLQSNTTGGFNTALGHNTLFFNSSGFNNTAVGYQSLLNTTGSDNVAVGQNAGSNLLANANTTGSGNTFIGTRSGSGVAAQLTNATALGFEALVSANNTLVLGGTGANAVNVGIGVTAPNQQLEITGNFQFPTTTAAAGVATGGVIFSGANRYIHNFGTNNFFAGVNAGNFAAAMTGSNNTGVGFQALQVNTTGASNTAVGRRALAANTSGTDNTAVGHTALAANISGTRNTVVGAGALTASMSGGANIALGCQALSQNISGSSNLALGDQALFGNRTGSFNIAVGNAALASNNVDTGGSSPGLNVAVGTNAGFSNVTGEGNVFLGSFAGSEELGSNKLYIDNNSTTTPLIWGDFNLNRVRINGSLYITTVADITGSTMVWRSTDFLVGRDLAEFFPASSGHLDAGSIAALGADGNVIAAKEGAQTLGPTPFLPGIIMDGSSQKIGPTLEDMRVPGKTPVALLGRVTVEVEGPVQVGDVLIAGPTGKAIRWEPGQSVLSYVGLVVEVNPKSKTATVLVGHQGLQKVLDSVQTENNALKERIEALERK